MRRLLRSNRYGDVKHLGTELRDRETDPKLSSVRRGRRDWRCLGCGARFHIQISVWEKILRTVLIYLFLLVALRLFGKRELGQANTLDLVVLLLVANAVQNGIIGNDVSVTGAVVGAFVLFALNAAFARGVFHWSWLSALLEGEPSLLIEDGQPNVKVLRRECISLPELRAIARRQGFPRSRIGRHRDSRDKRRGFDVPRRRCSSRPPESTAWTSDRQAPSRAVRLTGARAFQT